MPTAITGVDRLTRTLILWPVVISRRCEEKGFETAHFSLLTECFHDIKWTSVTYRERDRERETRRETERTLHQAVGVYTFSGLDTLKIHKHL